MFVVCAAEGEHAHIKPTTWMCLSFECSALRRSCWLGALGALRLLSAGRVCSGCTDINNLCFSECGSGTATQQSHEIWAGLSYEGFLCAEAGEDSHHRGHILMFDISSMWQMIPEGWRFRLSASFVPSSLHVCRRWCLRAGELSVSATSQSSDCWHDRAVSGGEMILQV